MPVNALIEVYPFSFMAFFMASSSIRGFSALTSSPSSTSSIFSPRVFIFSMTSGSPLCSAYSRMISLRMRCCASAFPFSLTASSMCFSTASSPFVMSSPASITVMSLRRVVSSFRSALISFAYSSCSLSPSLSISSISSISPNSLAFGFGGPGFSAGVGGGGSGANTSPSGSAIIPGASTPSPASSSISPTTSFGFVISSISSMALSPAA